MTDTFHITHDEAFLRRFRTKANIMILKDEDLELVREACEEGDIYAQYAYGRWLYYLNPHEGAMREAEQLFYNTKDTLPESEAAYALMVRLGETEVTRPPLMDIDLYKETLHHASERGSVLATFRSAYDRINGYFCNEEPEQVAKEIELHLADHPDCDPLWYEYLGKAYEALDQRDDAIKQYELAIEKGDISSFTTLARYYYIHGNMALYEEMMEEGCKKGYGDCFFYQGFYDPNTFTELSEEEQRTLHQTIDEQLHKGLALGDGICGYLLWHNHYYGNLGFEKCAPESILHYLKRGCELYDVPSLNELADIMEDDDFPLPADQRMNATEIAELRLKSARLDPDDQDEVRQLKRVSDPAFLLKYKEELDNLWAPRFEWVDKTILPIIDDEDEEEDEEEDHQETKWEPTAIEPSVIIIWPTGHLDIAEADVYRMKSFREVGQLIHADGLDTVHSSPALEQVKKAAGLKMNVAMYVDRDAQAKNLSDNAIGTILYGQGMEIRGPILIALEDRVYDCHSFTTLEDLTATYSEINDICGGLLIIKDEDDGRYDPYA